MKQKDDKEAEKPNEKPAEKPELKTPLEWAHALGHFASYGHGVQRCVLPSAAYATADVYYGWSQQVHHYGERSLVLSREDFTAAMDAAAKYPSVELHQPAISRRRNDTIKKAK